MLSKNLYSLCLLLSTPYNNLESLSNNVVALNSYLQEEIYLKKLFDFRWRKKLNSSFENFHFDYSYDLVEEYSNLIKVKLNLKIFFTIKDSNALINSACVHEYIIILENLHNKYKIHLLIENEENPILYNYILSTSISLIDNSIFTKTQSIYFDKNSKMDSLYESFVSTVIQPNQKYMHRNNSIFDIEKACAYAETYALKPNPIYKSFDGIGGDCTNFMSQILYAGGFKENSIWKPYTNPWIRVEDLYSYLTSQKLGIKLPDDSYLDRGCLIQFYTPSIGRYFHNGFITYKLQNNDCLYCCHSYNKLNYPLSEIYPHKYPKLRALKLS
ncbi:hypothetical protein D2A34_08210 [Clostridium chromiireducens]|uniref:Putative amidase domain-containing protein n=1 Tax=Clostridium chromiireducens TaxID=225345 RepID=A0A399IQB7_9CLOT|nr:amidase domain-containing protein [Clostridium chromiireducens]RII35181.1 hypothetical protein D2A34_08210 [Clostridium chromiireducens]